MKSFEYKSWRRGVFERDDFTCQMNDCDKRGGRLRAHHIKRYIDYVDLRLDKNNGITICEKCDNSFVLHRETQYEQHFFNNLHERGFLTKEDVSYYLNLKKR